MKRLVAQACQYVALLLYCYSIRTTNTMTDIVVKYIAQIILFMCVYGLDDTNQPVLLKIRNLNGLSPIFTPEYEQIFKPHYFDETKKYYKHNVHVTDEYGKFMKLYYEAQHPSNAHILKMDQTLHKINIKSMVCDDENIELQFKSSLITNEYFENIRKVLSMSNNNYFITAGHEWGCQNAQGRYESILRKITDVDVEEDQVLILQTQKAYLVDIFDKLDLRFETNMGMHQHKVDYQNEMAHRRRLNWVTDGLNWLWNKVGKPLVNSFISLVNKVKATVEKIYTFTKIVVQYTLNQPVNITGSPHYLWEWNYDVNNSNASESFELSKKFPVNAKNSKSATLVQNMECKNCYAYVKVGLEYQLYIEERTIKSAKLIATGDAEINIDIVGKAKVSGEIEIFSDSWPIPDFGFEVGNFKFGIFVGGAVAIGAEIETDIFVFKFNAKGSITKGFTYDAEPEPGKDKQNYISEQDFHFDRTGPKLSFTSVKVTIYNQITVYLTLEHVGSVYFGLRPQAVLTFEKNKKLKTKICPLYYTISPQLLPFIGVNISTLGFKWKKKIPLPVLQTDFINMDGCIDHFEVTQIQSDSDASTRRRLVPPLETNTATTFIDVSSIVNDNLMKTAGFGNVGSEWWANMSTIDELCDDWIKTCSISGTTIPMLAPDNATLLIHVIDDITLIAIYETFIPIGPGTKWNLDNVSVYSNVSCLARHRLILETANEHDDIPTYNVELLEFYCDVYLIDIGINETSNSFNYDAWKCLISLPSKVNALQLEGAYSFGNILIFDNTWCQVFSLTKTPHYVINETQINNVSPLQYPSKLWYGTWNCNETASSKMELYFTNFATFNGDIEAVLTFEDEENYYLSGKIDLAKRKMWLEMMYWYDNKTSLDEFNITFYGTINILADGVITYAGSIEKTGCTGFLFEGYFNVTQFDQNTDVLENISCESNEDKNLFCIAEDDELLIIGSICVLGLILCCLLTLLICCMKYRKNAQSKNKATIDIEMNAVKTN
eukprot:444256_1